MPLEIETSGGRLCITMATATPMNMMTMNAGTPIATHFSPACCTGPVMGGIGGDEPSRLVRARINDSGSSVPMRTRAPSARASSTASRPEAL